MFLKTLKEWMTIGVGIKRWIMMAALGTLLLIMGITEILLNRYFAPTYILYFAYLILSGLFLIYIAVNEGLKSFMNLIREGSLSVDTDSREIRSQLVERKLQLNGPEVVAIGGGTGLSTMLRGLKYYTGNLTAIVTVGDDGGGSGTLREEMKMLPPGDIRNCLVALANTDALMEELMQYRFSEGTLKGQSFGNLFIAAMDGMSDNFEEAVSKMSDVLAVTGKVLPVTLEDLRLEATFQDGTKIKGESVIGHSATAGNRIVKMEISPSDAKAPLNVIDSIEDAKAVIMGPGSLFTSVIPNILIKDVSEKLKETDAIKIYVCNIMTQPGETDGFKASDHFNTILSHADLGHIDYIIVNNKDIDREILKKYKKMGSTPVAVDYKALEKTGAKVISADIVNTEKGKIRHDPEKLANVLIRTILDDPKVKSGSNIIEYILNSAKRDKREHALINRES